MNEDEQKELVKNLRQIRAREVGYYALAYRTATEGFLMVSPKKIPHSKAQQIKKQVGAASLVTGSCTSDGSRAFVFETRRPNHGWLKLIKVLTKEAGFPISPEWLLAHDEEETVEGQAPADVPGS